MAWGFIMETPLTPDQYDRLDSEVGADPDGLIVHVAAKGADGIRIIDVWESKERSSGSSAIMPAAESMGMGGPNEPMPRDEFGELD